MKKYKFPYPLILFLVVLVSCRNESCKESTKSNLTLNFYKHNSTQDSAIYIFSVSGLNTDSIIYDSISMANSFILPLNTNSDTSQYELKLVTVIKAFLDSTKMTTIDTIIPEPKPDTIWKYSKFTNNILAAYTETLTVTYDREVELVSHECGFSYMIRLDTVWSTKNIADSIYLNKKTPIGFNYLDTLNSIWSKKNLIDSIIISNPNIERGIDAENIKIFL